MTDILVVTGLSGGGRSQAADSLEDMGWFVVDNLPVVLIDKVVELSGQAGGEISKLCLVVGNARQQAGILGAIETLRAEGHRVRIVFLEATTRELVRRYEATRRKHPLSDGSLGLEEVIERERGAIGEVKAAADIVIDTTGLNVHQLKSQLLSLFGTEDIMDSLQVSVMSFGFKHGVPGDCDFVFDARTLPNPYWDTALRPLTGRDPAVIRWLDERPEVQRLLDEYAQFIGARITEHRGAHRRYLTLGVGCTGGQHRSVYLVEHLAQRLAPEVPGLSRRHHSLDLPGRT